MNFEFSPEQEAFPRLVRADAGRQLRAADGATAEVSAGEGVGVGVVAIAPFPPSPILREGPGVRDGTLHRHLAAQPAHLLAQHLHVAVHLLHPLAHIENHFHARQVDTQLVH